MNNHKIIDNYGGCTGQLDYIQNNYSNLQTLTIGHNLALIPKGGKLHTNGAVQRALGAEAYIGYKCSSGTNVN